MDRRYCMTVTIKPFTHSFIHFFPSENFPTIIALEVLEENQQNLLFKVSLMWAQKTTNTSSHTLVHAQHARKTKAEELHNLQES